MGFFSFITNDTNESITNTYCSPKCKTVYLLDNKGNIWTEKAYEGYGVFGGKDIYQLFAEMNGIAEKVMPPIPEGEDDEDEEYRPDRSAGIDLWFKSESDPELEKTLVFPNLVHKLHSYKFNKDGNYNCNYEWVNKRPKHCPNQGSLAEEDDDYENDKKRRQQVYDYDDEEDCEEDCDEEEE